LPYTLGRHEDAIATYKKALDCAKDAALRAQSNSRSANASRNSASSKRLCSFYTKPIYEVPDPNEPPNVSGRANPVAPPPPSRNTTTVARRHHAVPKLSETCPDLKALADDVIRKIRVQHGILF